MMNVVPIIPEPNNDNVIELKIVDGKLARKDEVKYTKAGKVDRRHGNRVKGISSEVYPFNMDEIKAMINVFNNRIDEADGVKRQIACRNKMLFLIGINVGLRASDLVDLKWNFFLKNDMTFRDCYKLQPKKTRKCGKFVTLYFNQTVKKAITNYINEYPVEDLDKYLFKSRQGDGHISEAMLWKIINDAALEAGLKSNYGSHSLRKTYGYWAYHNAGNSYQALITLQAIYNHSSPQTTLRYIGITNDEMEDVFNSLNLGLNDM